MNPPTGLPRAAHPVTAGVGTHAGAAAWQSLYFFCKKPITLISRRSPNTGPSALLVPLPFAVTPDETILHSLSLSTKFCYVSPNWSAQGCTPGDGRRSGACRCGDMMSSLFHQTFTPSRCLPIVSSRALIPFLITLPFFVIFSGNPFPPLGIRKKEIS